jgi:GT2 family glycosyltransferase
MNQEFQRPLLSIVIKALNEEQKIEKAISSALAVADELKQPIEVVLADSVSTDATVQIARRFPVRIVQFRNIADRGCGAGVQLGFQYARGDYVYFIDGDMEIVPGFVSRALVLLQNDLKLAGVSGALVDTRIANDFDRIRVNNRAGTQSGYTNWLVGGGVYRRSAIEQCGGYAANRNLRGYEEAELGMRLVSGGWRLLRIGDIAVRHTGHSLDTWTLLARHWRSRRAMSAGVLLREAIGQPWFSMAARMLIHPLLTGAWLLAGGAAALVALASGLTILALMWVAMPLAVFGALCVKKRDPRHALISVISWIYGAAAITLGWFDPVVSPTSPIAAEVLQDLSPQTESIGQ